MKIPYLRDEFFICAFAPYGFITVSLLKLFIWEANKLKKEEILKNLKLDISDSKFRKYVRVGLIKSVKNGLGYGKGVLAEYPDNTIELIYIIEDYKKMGFQLKDIIFLLFCDGYDINFEKLRTHLIDHTEKMLTDIQFMIGKLSERDLLEWAINSYLSKAVRVKQPGRPSNEQLQELENKRLFEKQKIEYGFQFMNDFFEQKEFGRTSLLLFKHLGYEKDLNIKISKNLLSKENWIKNIKNSSEDDYKEIGKLIILIKYYYKFFLENGNDSKVYNRYVLPIKTLYKNASFKYFFQDPELIKLLIIIFILEPTWRQNLLMLLSLNDNVNNYDDLKLLLPPVLNFLDEKFVSEGIETTNE